MEVSLLIIPNFQSVWLGMRLDRKTAPPRLLRCAKILRYRGATTDQREDFEIGCILLQQCFFLPEREWIPVPKDFSLNIVQGKTYDADFGPGKDLWNAIQRRFASQPPLQFQVNDGTVMWSDPAMGSLGSGMILVIREEIRSQFQSFQPFNHCAPFKPFQVNAGFISPAGRTGRT